MNSWRIGTTSEFDRPLKKRDQDATVWTVGKICAISRVFATRPHNTEALHVSLTHFLTFAASQSLSVIQSVRSA